MLADLIGIEIELLGKIAEGLGIEGVKVSDSVRVEVIGDGKPLGHSEDSVHLEQLRNYFTEEGCDVEVIRNLYDSVGKGRVYDLKISNYTLVFSKKDNAVEGVD
jgi:hypothetical protein